jgi:uncharacterized protein YndB with AHSA1/START domain
MAKKPFEIQASIVIEATPAKVHEIMNDLARLDDWNPFMAMDKTVVATTPASVSARAAWRSSLLAPT